MRPWVIGVIIAAAAAQTAPDFEAASVKINNSGAAATSIGYQGGSNRFRAVNEPLWRLIAEAYRKTYQLRRFEIVDIPGAIDRRRFDIEAVAPVDATPAERQLMLQRLLAARFKLVVHEETREVPIFNLVKARADGRLGEHLKASAIDCVALRAAGGTPPPVADGETRPCVMNFGSGLLRARGMRIADLAEMGIARSVERPVVDRTGLTGGFDWNLEWTPAPPIGAPPADSASAIPIVTALQEQLGLRLEPARGPVPVVVVDRVELPTPD
jgi:uncharacterized protein (TIGR03435 family)